MSSPAGAADRAADRASAGTEGPSGPRGLPGLSRRRVVQAGAAGAVLWTTPLVQAVDVRAADAASGGTSPVASPAPPSEGCTGATTSALAQALVLGDESLPDEQRGEAGTTATGASSPRTSDAEALAVSQVLSGAAVSAKALSSTATSAITGSLSSSTAAGRVTELVLTIAGVGTLTARGFHGVATAQAGEGAAAGSTSNVLGTVDLNGLHVVLGSRPNQSVTVPGTAIVLTTDVQDVDVSGGGGAARSVVVQAVALRIVVPALAGVTDGLRLDVGRGTASAAWPC